MKIIKILRKTTTSISPVLSTRIMYRVKMHKKLNLKYPQTFNEKINWLKIYDYPFNKKVINCTDKYNVREYVKNKGYENILVPLYNSWSNVEDIIFSELPNKFVLKCNHGCGYNIICKDKTKLNINKEKKKIKKWMKENFGKVSGELHYDKIKKRIICEKFLEDDILDYKFFCFKGKPEFFYVAQNINGDFHNMQADFLNLDGTLADFERTDHNHFKVIPSMPQNLNTMIKISEKLSEDFEFVRVDLFNVNGKIYFSELTFSPCSGYMPFDKEEIDLKYGKMIDLEI